MKGGVLIVNGDRIKKKIKENKEEEIYLKLKEYVRTLGWFKTEEKIEQYSLELYDQRLFENVCWVDYDLFRS